jgi:hypothetical protein
MKLFKGTDEIDLYYFGTAHTNGDAFVVSPRRPLIKLAAIANLVKR